MRIAFVCTDPGVPVFGRKGCSVHVQEVIRALKQQGARVELFATSFGGDLPQGFEDVLIRQLPVAPKGSLAEREQLAIAANWELDRALRRVGRFDLVYERYSLWSFAAMEYAQVAAVPAILEVNAPLVEEQSQHRGLVDRAGAERVAERVFAAADVLVAVSDGIAAYLERYPNVRTRVVVIPNAVNPDRFPENLREFRAAGLERFIVGFVGTLKPWHGLPVLVEAFDLFHRRNSSARLLIVGTGPQYESLTENVSARGLMDAIRFTGAVNPGEVPDLLASMDVATAPYLNQPGFYFSPLKVYEYMAAGLPVVASSVGQLKGLIQDGINGLLCTAGDPQALAARLDTLRLQPGLRSRLGRAARAAVLQNHTWRRVAERILDLAMVSTARALETIRT
jgi:glycosyltransferase involved in cell wall biosynthesis